MWDQRITRSKADEKWKNKNRMLQKIAGALFSELDGFTKRLNFQKFIEKLYTLLNVRNVIVLENLKQRMMINVLNVIIPKKNHKYSLEKGRHAVRMMLGAYCVALKRFKITPPFTEIEKILAGKDLPGVDIPSRRISQRTRKHHGTVSYYFSILWINYYQVGNDTRVT